MTHITKSNAIPSIYQDELEDFMFSRKFPWSIVHESLNNNTQFSAGFSHLALNDGPVNPKGFTATPIASSLVPISYIMGDILGKSIKKLLRIRVGLLLPTTNVSNMPRLNFTLGGDDAHVDFMMPHYTGLYYVNDSDGDTIVYNEKQQSTEYTELTRSSPEKGKIFIFDGEHYHASSKPINSYARIVLTYNFTVDE